ncbi:MAG: aldo/keto reductase [Gallionellales bacterium 35-53-114]|jgi:diketogulonate reductase-like aldo/keto reductase|nr:MAG: aldo/keto reductase [Gallionellales bacterium 35-53-114]OYZ65233.1 MAG: aldo/keto reductase [Gallionellales bacterium 24-53-125]OZB08139.1 MAG: aldo/keto reductase [Gallionellales bacterium 39-52-133]HQS58062.1 aldo/keto reductase [Gallionellaceae bacterium]HQS73617.1 aldo/keto reductase [Gallionellaceae bacterium]
MTTPAKTTPPLNNSRRRLLGMIAASPLLVALPGLTRHSQPATRAIPSSGEALPLVGLGSWISFNVGNDKAARDASAEVMRNFFQAGGRLIDSSPMYGSAQEVIGYGLTKIGRPAALFAADKVWVSGGDAGRAQMEESRQLWGIPRFDLLQVHNLLSWEAHLPTLFTMKANGRLRYTGITTSHGRRHGDMEQLMKSQPLDFIQLTYNLYDREAEQRLLPLALERGIAVIVNRPFQQGALLRRLARHPLPSWAAEIDCSNWAQFALKFVISHPAVTCAIPATTRVAHVLENMGTASGRLPDQAMRARMAAFVDSLS